VRPSNVILSPSGGATLVDFAWSRSAIASGWTGADGLDRVRYLAPEQAGLVRRAVDGRTDLYAVGALLFEALAGRPLFDGATAGLVLRQHLSGPRALRRAGAAVPRAVDEAIERLLRPDPDDRYATAEAARGDIGEIAAALASGLDAPPFAIGSTDRRRTLAAPAFVGRADEIATLEAALERARRGAAGYVSVEAEAGEGKTRLLDELHSSAASAGAWVLRGRGATATATHPTDLLAGVTREIVARARADPTLAARLGGRLGDRREAAVVALPALVEVLGPRAKAPLGPERFGLRRTVDALSTLTAALGTRERPAVIILDDAQWADEVTLALLERWLAPGPGADDPGEASFVLCVVGFRPEDVPASSPLHRASPEERVRLAPLPSDDVRRLLLSMAGPLPEEAVSLVSHLAGGNPFLAAATLEGLVESGALAADASGWRARPEGMAVARTSRRAALTLAARIERLPDEARSALSIGAVLGREIAADAVAALAGEAVEGTLAALEEARRRHLLFALGEGRFAFVHDQVREALLEALPDETRSRIHRAAARRIEDGGRGAAEPFDLAWHLDRAAEPERALPHAIAAAEAARRSFAFEIAETYYRIAERGAAAADGETRRRVAEGLGEVLLFRRRFDEATRWLEAARALAGDALARARIEGKLGEVALGKGETGVAALAFERALEALGRRVPRGRAGRYAGLGAQLVRQAMHTVLGRAVGRAPPGEIEEADRLAIDFYIRLAHAYSFDRPPSAFLWAHLAGLNLAERRPGTAEVARAYGDHVNILIHIPLHRRAIAYGARGSALARDAGDPAVEAHVDTWYGSALLFAGEVGRALPVLASARRAAIRSGDPYRGYAATIMMAVGSAFAGRAAEGAEMARGLCELGAAEGLDHAHAFGIYVWSWASGGRVPEPLIASTLAGPGGGAATRGCALAADGIRILREGRLDEAAARLEEALRVHRPISRSWVVPIEASFLATARRRAAEATSPLDPRRRRALVRIARAAGKLALRYSRAHPIVRPHALRERALVAVLEGRPRRARRLLDESIALARRCGLPIEEALARLARAHAGAALGWPEAAEDAAAGRRGLRDGGTDAVWMLGSEEGTPSPAATPITPALADRFESLLAIGREIATAPTHAALIRRVEEAGRTLLRGDACRVLGVGDRPSEPEVEPLVRAAVEAVAPVVSIDEGHGLRPRSSLVAPIVVRGAVRASLVATHRGVGGLFGDEERRLAAYVAALAGAAWENVDRLAEVQARSRRTARGRSTRSAASASASSGTRRPSASGSRSPCTTARARRWPRSATGSTRSGRRSARRRRCDSTRCGRTSSASSTSFATSPTT